MVGQSLGWGGSRMKPVGGKGWGGWGDRGEGFGWGEPRTSAEQFAVWDLHMPGFRNAWDDYSWARNPPPGRICMRSLSGDGSMTGRG